MTYQRTFPPPVAVNDWPLIHLDRDVALACKAMADDIGMTMADFVRMIIDEELAEFLSGRRDLNARPLGPEPSALPS